MPHHGQLEEYDPQEEWSQYIERLEYYFEANGVDNADKQRAILLSVCGSKMYKLIRNLTTPEKPSEKTFNELIELVQKHQNPKPSAIVQRFKFNTRFRKPGESIASYVAELRNLSEHCDFQNTLEEMLRDRLVCGMNDEQIQRRLLAECSLDFKKAMKIATSMETAVKNAKDLTHQMANATRNTEQPSALNRVHVYDQRQGNHQDQMPNVEDVAVNIIPRMQISRLRVFPLSQEGSKASGQNQRRDYTSSSLRPSSNYLNTKEEETEEEDDNYGLYSLGKQRAEPYVVDVLMEVDIRVLQ